MLLAELKEREEIFYPQRLWDMQEKREYDKCLCNYLSGFLKNKYDVPIEWICHIFHRLRYLFINEKSTELIKDDSRPLRDIDPDEFIPMNADNIWCNVLFQQAWKDYVYGYVDHSSEIIPPKFGEPIKKKQIRSRRISIQSILKMATIAVHALSRMTETNLLACEKNHITWNDMENYYNHPLLVIMFAPYESFPQSDTYSESMENSTRDDSLIECIEKGNTRCCESSPSLVNSSDGEADIDQNTIPLLALFEKWKEVENDNSLFVDTDRNLCFSAIT
jgi:hypothetical protein